MSFQAEEKSATISEILVPIKVAIIRHWRVSLFPALAVFFLTMFTASRLPNYYTADATLFVQPQRLNLKLIDSPEQKEMSERFDALMLNILSRKNIWTIVEDYNLYPEHRGIAGKEYAIAKFRNNIRIAPVTLPSGKELLQTFKLSFTDPEPKISFKVVKKVTDLFIRESTVSRVGELQATKEFLNSQLTEARKQLEATENKIKPFMQQNFGKLPEHLDQSIARLQNAQSTLESNSRLIAANLQRKSNLENELKVVRANEQQVSSSALSQSGTLASDRPTALKQLQDALRILESKYTPKHPEVRAVRERIAALQASAPADSADARARLGNGATGGMSPLRFSLVRQINDVSVEINQLQQENQQLKTTVAQLEKDIKNMPSKEQELIAIRRDYENVSANYERLLQAKQEAELQSKLNLTQRGAKFRIVDEAALPSSPSDKPGQKLALMGGGIGILSFFGMVLGLHFLGNSFKLSKELEEDTGLPVLEIIPPVVTADVISRNKRQLFASFSCSVVVFALGSGLLFWKL
jgi:polysaccharide chain length determinant protein (PEP-CTERM system associated)